MIEIISNIEKIKEELILILKLFLSEEELENSSNLIKVDLDNDTVLLTFDEETVSKKIGGYVIAQVVTITSVGLIFTIALLSPSTYMPQAPISLLSFSFTE